MWLATAPLFEPRWSTQIHEEWISNLLEARADLTRAQLERTRDLMNVAIPDALVTGYDTLMESLTLPDPDDRHVLAAAIVGKATMLVTFNRKDFPTAIFTPFGITRLSPDQFALRLYRAYPAEFLRTVERHRTALRNPPKTWEEYLNTLRNNQLSQIADILKAERSN